MLALQIVGYTALSLGVLTGLYMVKYGEKRLVEEHPQLRGKRSKAFYDKTFMRLPFPLDTGYALVRYRELQI